MNAVGEVAVGLVGYGYWGPNLARNLVAVPGARLAGLCEPNTERRERARRLYPWIGEGEDFAGLIADPRIDAVVIATPLSTHFALALAALEAGKHVLLEKPMTATVDQARELIAAAKRVRRVLMVDHPYVHAPAVEYLCAFAARGETGRLLHYDSVRANLGPFHAEPDVIWDLAVHDLSILERLTSRQPREVIAIGAGNGAPQDPEIAHLIMRYDDGFLAHLHLSWLSPVKIRRVSLAGSRALVLYDALDASEPLRVYAGDGEGARKSCAAGDDDHAGAAESAGAGNDGAQQRARRDRLDGVDQRRIGYRLGDMTAPRLVVEEPLYRMCVHFIACVHDGAEALTGGESGLRVASVLEAARSSLLRGGSPTEVVPV